MDGSLRANGSTQAAANAFRTIPIKGNRNRHGAVLRTDPAACTQCVVNFHPIQAESVEKTIQGAQRAKIAAKRAFNQN